MSTSESIPERDFAVVLPAIADRVRGVTAGGKSVVFPLDAMPVPSGVSEQLAEVSTRQDANDQQLDSLDSRVHAVEVSQSAGMIGVATFSALPAAGTNGRLYQVTNDPVSANNGTWRDNGAIWVQSVDRVSTLEQKVAHGQVLTDEVSVSAGGVNKFSTIGATAGVSVSAADGTTFAKANWSTTDFLPVDPDTPYRRSTLDAYAQYDANKQFIVGAASASTFATAKNARFVRLGYANSTAGTEMLAKAAQWPGSYVAFVQAPKVDAINLPSSAIESVAFPAQNMLRDDLAIGPRNAEFLVHASQNLFDKTRVTAGMRLSLTQIPAYDTSNNITEYIPVKPSTQYAVSEGSFTHEYDAAKSLIHSHGTGITSFTTQASSAYIRTTVRNVRLADMMIVEGASVPAAYVPYDRYAFGPEIIGGSSGRFAGTTWNAMGDSITAAAGSYVDTVASSLGAAQARNYGIGGTAIAVRAAPWDTNAMCVRYADMDASAGLVTVAGGTNDFGTSVILGDMTSTATNTFYGALHALCQGLIARYPSAAIVFLTPLPRATMNTDNGRGLKLSAYVAAMKEVCAYYAIPVVDLYRLTHFRPWNTDNAAALMPDGLHPNSAGYAMMSGIISQQLRGL